RCFHVTPPIEQRPGGCPRRSRALAPYVSQFWRPDRTNLLAARLFDPSQYPGRRSGLVDKGKARRTTMKASMIAALMLVAMTAVRPAQPPTADDPHHPPQSATRAPAPAQPPTTQPGTGMMGDMPMMNMMATMRMMEIMGPGMVAMDRIEG